MISKKKTRALQEERFGENYSRCDLNNFVLTTAPLFVIWVFPKIGVPQNGWFLVENLIKIDDLGVPLVLETSICFIMWENNCVLIFTDTFP